jgi:ribosomal protein L14
MIRRIGQNKKTASIGDIIVCHVKESSTEASVKTNRGKSGCR